MPKPIPASASSAITAATRRAVSDHSDGGSGEGSEVMGAGVLRTPRLPRRGPVNWLTDQSINGSRRPAGSATARETTMNFALNDEQLGLIHSEEMHWGCAGIALAINGSGLAAAGVAASGTPEQIAEWVPQCLGV